MQVDFENALSRLANDPTDLVAWSVVLDAFENKVSNIRKVNGKELKTDVTLSLASTDFTGQGTSTTILHGNATGAPFWNGIATNDIIASNVTFPKIQNISTSRILGRLTAGSGTIEQLTGTQLTTLLDIFSTSATTKGVVPGSNGVGNTYFLRADGTWAVPIGTGVDHATLSNLSYAAAGHTGFEPSVSSGTTAQYYRGDKSWQDLSAAILSALPNHNDLAGLEGGGSGHYYHVTSAQSVSVGVLTTTGADITPLGLTCSGTAISTANDGTITANATLTWTAIVTATFDHYLIRYKRTAATYYTYIVANTNTITIEGLIPNTSYDFGIASVNKYGTLSSFSVDITQTSATNTAAPATVTGVTATAGIQYIIVEWDAAAEKDLAGYNVYRNIINDSSTSTLIGTCKTDYFIDGGRTGGQVYYYWIKSVNTSGLISTNYSSPANATPRNVQTADVEVIAANKILIDGVVYLTNWQKGGDLTKIDGGQISANTITTTQLNFTPVSDGDVIASINASLEGIKIDADNLTISGSTTFDSGYNPTEKVAALGGQYDSSAGAARVRIFPDVNTGIQIIDDGGSDVFKAIIGGTNVGDVIIGNWAGGQGIFYDKSAGTTSFAGTVSASGGTIGGWTVDSDSIYHGTEQTGDGYSSDGITLHDDGSIHGKKFYINADGSAMIAGLDITHLIPKVASANVRHGVIDDSDEESTNGSWAKMKQFLFTNGLLGQFRVRFDLKKTEAVPGDGKARIRKNGVDIGTERVADLGYVTFTEDFTTDLQPGDTIEIWGYATASVDTYVKNFAITYDNNFSVAVAAVGS